MKRTLQWVLALGMSLWLAAALAQEFATVPPLTGHVVDRVGLLKADQRAALDEVLSQYEARTGSQIAVLLVSTTAPEAIEQYSIRVAEAWKLGRKNVDDGVILLLAKDNPKSLHRLRIEAGRGVQGSLTDLQSKRILQEVMAPYFQRNDFSGGLAAGVAAITSLLDKEQLPAPPSANAATGQSAPLSSMLPALLLIAVIVMVIVIRSRRATVSGLDQGGWGRTAGVILGSGLGSTFGTRPGGSFDGGSGGTSGGMSGGGGGFDGGGASGDW